MNSFLKYSLYALLLCRIVASQAQDFGYWVSADGVIYQVSLSTGEAVEQIRFTLPDNQYLSDAMYSGDSVIYLAIEETLVKYSIARNDFEEIATIPGYFAFHSVINANEISLEITEEKPEAGGPRRYFDYFIFNLTDQSLTPTGQASVRYIGATIRNQIDSTLWIRPAYGAHHLWKQYNTLTNEQNSPFFISQNGWNKLAFDREGNVFWVEKISGEQILKRVDVQTSSLIDIGNMGDLVDGLFMIPFNNIEEGRSLYISTPALGLFSHNVDFEPLHWTIKAINTGTENFTIDSIRWSNSLLSIAGPIDNVTLTQGNKRDFEFTYMPENESRVSDVLRIYANSEGLYREIPVAASLTLGFDEKTVPPLETDNLLLKEGEEIVERNEVFEKVNTLTATCASCRHRLSPNGRLFRLNEETLLSVYDPSEERFNQISDLSDKFGPVFDFTFQDDRTLTILIRYRAMLSRSGLMGPRDPASDFYLYRYDMVADSVLQRLHYDLVFDDEAAVKGLPQAIEYNDETGQLMILHNVAAKGTSEIRLFEFYFRPSDHKVFKSALFNDLYRGRAESWFGLQPLSIAHIDTEQQRYQQITSLQIRPDEIIGFGYGDSGEFRLSHQSIDFGQVFLQQQELARISLANLSERDIVLESIVFDNSEFSYIEDLPLQISADTQSLALTLGFLTQSAGPVNGIATLTLFDGDLRWEQVIVLEGTGVESADVIHLANEDVNFGEVYLGGTGLETLAVDNLSTQWVEVQSISFDHNDYSYSGELPLFIKPGLSGLLENFMTMPDVQGEVESNATIMFNDGINSWQRVVPLKASVSTGVDLNSISIDFGKVSIDRKLVRALGVNNKDTTVPVRFYRVSIDNPAFKMESLAGVDIDAAMVDFPISFSFKPTGETVESGVATLSFSRNDVSWDVPIDLMGEGVLGELVTGSEEVDFLTGMKIFPNPLKNTNQLSFSNVNPKVEELQFYNIHGQLKYSHHIESLTEFNLHLDGFTSEGMILIRFLSKDGKHLGSRPVLIQH